MLSTGVFPSVPLLSYPLEGYKREDTDNIHNPPNRRLEMSRGPGSQGHVKDSPIGGVVPRGPALGSLLPLSSITNHTFLILCECDWKKTWE